MGAHHIFSEHFLQLFNTVGHSQLAGHDAFYHANDFISTESTSNQRIPVVSGVSISEWYVQEPSLHNLKHFCRLNGSTYRKLSSSNFDSRAPSPCLLSHSAATTSVHDGLAD